MVCRREPWVSDVGGRPDVNPCFQRTSSSCSARRFILVGLEPEGISRVVSAHIQK